MAKPPCIRCDCRFQRRFGWLVFTQATRSFRTRMIGAEGRHASHNRSALGSGGEIVLGHARLAAGGQGQAGLVQRIEMLVIESAIQQMAAQPHRISRACLIGVDIASPTISPRPSAQAARPFSATPSSRQTARVRSGLFSV